MVLPSPTSSASSCRYGAARAAVFPTIAEGCGLPVIESLWRGVPCVCSDLPVLRENTAGGGCLTAAVNDPAGWARQVRAVLTDEAVAPLHLEALRAGLGDVTMTALALPSGEGTKGWPSDTGSTSIDFRTIRRAGPPLIETA